MEADYLVEPSELCDLEEERDLGVISDRAVQIQN